MTERISTTTATTRGVAEIIDSISTHEGAGFPVNRPFPTQRLNFFDPFLLLDEMGPVVYGPGEAKGAPDHPHRGFETVTYVLEGLMQHKDSRGNAGKLGPNDVQWMTAGAGIVHSEMPEDGFLARGGLMHGFQLWVNLPAKDKMTRPRYQEVPGAGIPTAQNAAGSVRVRIIAGEAMGVSAVIDTHTPILYLHYQLEPGASAEQLIPEGSNAFAYVVAGEGYFGPERRPATRGQMVVFDADGESASFAAGDAPLSFLLLAGTPLHEPVARYGPFVMNTREEIVQAVEDYRSGRMGAIDF